MVELKFASLIYGVLFHIQEPPLIHHELKNSVAENVAAHFLKNFYLRMQML